ncbi:MAG: PDZ domain-containing protein [Planctomycetes bacterium]|jgi:membrane-associated protease RseP (regulator of RpoE activity)|nr:PDZ domain-containing protein [Planctomycetota bacterium]
MRLAATLLTLVSLSAPAFAAQSGYEAAQNPENRPMLGVQMTPVPLSVQEQQGLAPNQGVYVQSVYGNTAAQTMGLQPGDVITSVNGAPIGSMSDLRNEVALNQVGDPVEVTIQRGGQEQSTIGQFQPWPANIPYDPIDPAMEQRFREWQERRLARMQDEVEQLRNQAQELAAKAATNAANQDDGILGVQAKPLVGPDGQPIAWRFRYGIAGVPGQDVPTAAMESAASESAPGAPTTPTAVDARNWHFTWNLLSLRPAQEPL